MAVRREVTRAPVRSSVGPCCGVTARKATFGFSAGCTGLTSTTPSSAAISLLVASAVPAASVPSNSTTNGFCSPAPNAVLTVVYAARWELAGSGPPGGSSSVCSDRAGTASTATITVAPSMLSTGRSTTVRAQRRSSVGRVGAGVLAVGSTSWAAGAVDPAPGRSLRGRALWPRVLNTAGTIVSETATATTTANAAPSPISVMNEIRTIANPARAMTTVVPATTTEVPAVPAARATAVATSAPRRNSSRYLDRISRA
jgi:hypothetical protein